MPHANTHKALRLGYYVDSSSIIMFPPCLSDYQNNNFKMQAVFTLCVSVCVSEREIVSICAFVFVSVWWVLRDNQVPTEL